MELKTEETYTDKEETSICEAESSTGEVRSEEVGVESELITEKSPTVVEESPNRIYIDGVRWFTYKQLAAILHCTPQSVYNHVKSGKVKTKKIDGVSFFRLDEYM